MSTQKTPLHSEHLRLGARMLEFAGFDMPISYDQYSGGMRQEHLKVRQDCGMFDVSHMGEFWISGEEAIAFLSFATTRDFHKSKDTKAYYCLLLNSEAGILDDIIVYRVNAQEFLMVVNAANLEKDWKHLQSVAKEFQVKLQNRSEETALIAVQGPMAETKLRSLVSGLENLGYYSMLQHGDWIFGRTGYTGEDGFEIFLPRDQAADLWRQLEGMGIWPIGLGARDTLRLEVGFPLYGQELREDLRPHETLSAFAVRNTTEFLGHQGLKEPARWKPVALIGSTPKPMRAHEKIFYEGRLVGELTSGSTSPSLKLGMGIGLVESSCPLDEAGIFMLESAGKQREANLTQLPFVESGRVKKKSD